MLNTVVQLGERLSAYMTPPYGLRAAGPLMAGGCAGAVSGAGIRFWNAGICGAGDPRSVVGLRTTPQRPDLSTQANTEVGKLGSAQSNRPKAGKPPTS
jgi:hypothetical protein